MKLRTAVNSQSDFEAYMRLYEDLDTTQLYIYEPSKEPVNEEERLEAERFLEGFDLEVLKYTQKEFEFDTTHKNIIFVELDGKVISVFYFFSITRKRYKFADWCISKEYQHMKEEIWTEFLSFFKKIHKGTKEFDVCLLSTEAVLQWFKEHGFVDKGAHFYTLYM